MAKTEFRIPHVLQTTRAAAMRGVIRGTERVRSKAIDIITQGSRSGRIYRRRGVEHQASAPGEPPATDTGNYIRNIQTRYDQAGLAGVVNFGTAYASRLEFGFVGVDEAGRTQDFAARPHARPALESERRGIQEDIRQEIERGLKG